MMRMLSRHAGVYLFWLLLGVLLAVEFGLPFPTGGADASLSASNAGVDLETSLQGLELGALQSYRNIVQETAFSPLRRVPEQKQELLQQKSLLGWKLTGVVISPGLTLAILNHARSRKSTSLVVGDQLEGWRVEAIARDEIVFTAGGNRTELHVNKTAP